MNEAARPVRVAEMRQQRADPLQPEFDGPVLVAERVQEANRVWVRSAQDANLADSLEKTILAEAASPARFDFFSARRVFDSGGPIRNNGQGAQELIFREAEDRELAGRARKGDLDAFNALVSRWETRIYNYLLRITGHADDALDLCQDTFIKAYQNLARLEDPARFGPWLYRIAHNEAMSHLRRPQRETELDDAAAAAMRASLAPVEASLAVEAALARLSPEQREAVILKVYEGFKFDEIAAILNCPASTIKSRVYTGLELLKEALAPVRPPEKS